MDVQRLSQAFVRGAVVTGVWGLVSALVTRGLMRVVVLVTGDQGTQQSPDSGDHGSPDERLRQPLHVHKLPRRPMDREASGCPP